MMSSLLIVNQEWFDWNLEVLCFYAYGLGENLKQVKCHGQLKGTALLLTLNLGFFILIIVLWKLHTLLRKCYHQTTFASYFCSGFGGYCFPFLNIKNKGSKITWYFQSWWMRSFLFRPCLEKSWSLNRGSAGGSTVKNPPAMQETWVLFLGREDPLEKQMAIHSSILAWEIPWTEEPDRLQSVGLQKSRTRLTNWPTTTESVAALE